MVANATFTRESDGSYRVAGHLGFTSVHDVLRASASMLDSQGQQSSAKIDLSGIQSADSAGLALLIEWYCRAQRANRSVRFINAPKQLRALAKISDLEGILPFDQQG